MFEAIKINTISPYARLTLHNIAVTHIFIKIKKKIRENEKKVIRL